MIWIYLKTAYRNLWGNKGHAFINIAGLSIGLTCSMFIFLWVREEMNTDTFHRENANLYTVFEQINFDHRVTGQYYTPALLAATIRKELPEVKYASATNFNFPGSHTFAYGSKQLTLQGSFADADFFKMFSYPLLAGNSQSALSRPGTVAISNKMARYFFGSPGDAMGKMIKYDDGKELTVSAVFRDINSNSSFRFDYLVDWYDFMAANQWSKNWDYNGPMTFIALNKGADPLKIKQQLDTIMRARSFTEKKDIYARLAIQRYDQRYLSGTFRNGLPTEGRIKYVRLFTAVGFFILVIACINFTNLATARSTARAKEISLRKLAGAGRASLIAQLFGESLLVTFFAVLLALFMFFNLFPLFNSLTGKDLALPFNQYQFWAGLGCLSLFTGILSGIYPAIMLSAFDPLHVLRGKYKRSRHTRYFREALVMFQFVFSAVLIICAIVITRQVHFFIASGPGYEPENLLALPMEGNLLAGYEKFKTETLQLPGVLSVTRSFRSPVKMYLYTTEVRWMPANKNPRIAFANNSVGYDFTGTMKLKLLSGRDFSPDQVGDSSAYLINESAAKRMGFARPLGKIISLFGGRGPVIGVMRDFHHVSLEKPIAPLILSLGEHVQGGFLLIRTEAGRRNQVVAALKTLYSLFNPAFPFTIQDVNEQYRNLYKSEYTIERLSSVFAVLAIFIACLGLLGMATFTAGQREREMGVRKILGAGAADLLKLIAAEFLLPVILGLIIAIPLAWTMMDQWLKKYAYHTHIDIQVFIVAAALCIGIALVTISIQAMKVMFGRPVELLKEE